MFLLFCEWLGKEEPTIQKKRNLDHGTRRKCRTVCTSFLFMLQVLRYSWSISVGWSSLFAWYDSSWLILRWRTLPRITPESLGEPGVFRCKQIALVLISGGRKRWDDLHEGAGQNDEVLDSPSAGVNHFVFDDCGRKHLVKVSVDVVVASHQILARFASAWQLFQAHGETGIHKTAIKTVSSGICVLSYFFTDAKLESVQMKSIQPGGSRSINACLQFFNIINNE